MEQLGETPGGPPPLPLPPSFEEPKKKTIKINKEEIKKRAIGIVKSKVPIVEWLPKYNLKNLKGDLVAGITVGVMLIPQAMAYALVAGLPPIYGLYSSIVPLIIFGLFTTSKHLSVGPFAIISLLVGDAVAQYLGDEKGDVEKYVSVTILLTFMCGIIKLVFGILRFGFLVNFLSDPVRSGFNSASAIIIGVSQLRHLFGVPVPSEDFAWMTVFEIAKEIPHTNGWSFLIGVVGIAMLVAMKKISKKYKITIPGALIVVALGTLISWAAKLEQNAHIIVVGSVPSGFPPIRNPFAAADHFWDAVVQLSSSALIIVVVTFISSMAISTKFAEQFHYKVNANQELLAMGLADTFGSLFSAYPLAASLSRTAVNVQSGARTPLAGILSTILVIVTLLFLAPVVYFIPRALLASIVLVAVVDIIEYNKVRELWSVHKKDTVLLLLAFFSTLFIGILQGLLIGIGASLALILYRSAYPPVAELGRLMGSTTYINCKRFPQSVTVPGLVIVRFDGSLYFSNVEHVRKRLRTYILKNTNCSPDDAIRWVVLDCSSMIDIDSTAIRGLKESVLELRQNNIQLIFTCLKGPIRDAIKRCGVVGLAGPDHFFWSVHDAVKNYYYVVLNTIPPSLEEEQKLQHGNIHSPQVESFDPSKKDPGGSCKGYAQPQTKYENDNTSSSGYNSSTGDFDSTNSVNSNNNNNNNYNYNSSAVVVVDNEFSPFVFDTEESVDNAHTPLLASIALPKLNIKLPTL